MCIGIAIVGVVPADGSPIQFYGRSGNSSHDTLLSESVPVELHNRSFKIEYIFPNELRLDAPDNVCRSQAQDLGIAEITLGVAVLRPEISLAVCNWLRENPLKHDLTTIQDADLSGADLSGADLAGADLSGADLAGADLSGANLSGANLSWADLSGADLSGANLFRADLSRADLSGADLAGANLSGANLSRADLSWADLSGANLSRADLAGADLFRADLSRANLTDEQKKIAKEKGALVVD